jgi:hypothetical protein
MDDSILFKERLLTAQTISSYKHPQLTLVVVGTVTAKYFVFDVKQGE